MRDNRNIVLIGMMGCGKTTCGRLLSQRLGRPLVDTDALIAQREGRSIPEIFAAEGEAYFRAREEEVAKELAGQQGLVIACGGGLPLREAAIAPLAQTGQVFWIRRDPGQTYDSLNTADRPLAQQGRAEFLARFAQREPVYRRWARHIIQGHEVPQEAVDRIVELNQEGDHHEVSHS